MRDDIFKQYEGMGQEAGARFACVNAIIEMANEFARNVKIYPHVDRKEFSPDGYLGVIVRAVGCKPEEERGRWAENLTQPKDYKSLTQMVMQHLEKVQTPEELFFGAINNLAQEVREATLAGDKEKVEKLLPDDPMLRYLAIKMAEKDNPLDRRQVLQDLKIVRSSEKLLETIEKYRESRAEKLEDKDKLIQEHEVHNIANKIWSASTMMTKNTPGKSTMLGEIKDYTGTKMLYEVNVLSKKYNENPGKLVIAIVDLVRKGQEDVDVAKGLRAIARACDRGRDVEERKRMMDLMGIHKPPKVIESEGQGSGGKGYDGGR